MALLLAAWSLTLVVGSTTIPLLPAIRRWYKSHRKQNTQNLLIEVTIVIAPIAIIVALLTINLVLLFVMLAFSLIFVTASSWLPGSTWFTGLFIVTLLLRTTA